MNKKQKAMTPPHKTLHIGLIMAASGGFIDAYTYITRGGVFAFAQTGNIIFMGINLTEGNFLTCLMYAVPIAAYFVGVFITDYLNTKITRNRVVTIEVITIAAEILLLILVGCMPPWVPNIIVTLVVSFLSAIQVQSFRAIYNTPYACTMCTGNLRSSAERLRKYFSTKEKEHFTHFLRYTAINTAFFTGAAAGTLFSNLINEKAALVVCLMLSLSLFMIVNTRRKKINLSHFEK